MPPKHYLICQTYAAKTLQNQKPLVLLGVPSLMFPGVGRNFRGIPSCSKENVLGKHHLSQRNQYKIFLSTSRCNRSYRGTSTAIVILDDELSKDVGRMEIRAIAPSESLKI